MFIGRVGYLVLAPKVCVRFADRDSLVGEHAPCGYCPILLSARSHGQVRVHCRKMAEVLKYLCLVRAATQAPVKRPSETGNT